MRYKIESLSLKQALSAVLFSSSLYVIGNWQQQAVWGDFVKNADDFHLRAGNNYKLAAQRFFDGIFCHIFA